MVHFAKVPTSWVNIDDEFCYVLSSFRKCQAFAPKVEKMAFHHFQGFKKNIRCAHENRCAKWCSHYWMSLWNQWNLLVFVKCVRSWDWTRIGVYPLGNEHIPRWEKENHLQNWLSGHNDSSKKFFFFAKSPFGSFQDLFPATIGLRLAHRCGFRDYDSQHQESHDVTGAKWDELRFCVWAAWTRGSSSKLPWHTARKKGLIRV